MPTTLSDESLSDLLRALGCQNVPTAVEFLRGRLTPSQIRQQYPPVDTRVYSLTDSKADDAALYTPAKHFEHASFERDFDLLREDLRRYQADLEDA